MTPVPFVFLSAVRYEHCLSGRTRRIADCLASLGHDVTFVEMPSLKATAAGLRRAPLARGAPGPRIVRLAPFPGYLRLHSTAAARLWVRFVRRQLMRRVANLERAMVIVSTPWWLPVLQGLPRRLLCYDYIDHLAVHSGERHGAIMSAWDAALLSMCDVVSTVSVALKEALGRRVDPARIRLIPNGVEDAWLDGAIEPIPRRDLTGGADRPVAGFLGALFEWIDLPLLAAAAAALPETVFALVGPTRHGIDLDPLRGLGNVRCFPAQPYAQVPRWIGAFDVCLIPFKNDVISHHADPIKLYEYLALGKPVVSSVRFSPADDPAPILVADTPARFADGIRQCLSLGDSPEQRIAFARRHTWNKRAADFVAWANRHGLGRA